MSKLEYSRSGNPEGPWLTLAHSLATDMRMWEEQLPRLEADFQILRYNARGHGGSPLPDNESSMHDLVRDVLELWDALGIERSHFLGLSMGGMTGIGLALHSPERVERLIACDCRLDAPEFFRDMWEQRISAVEARGMAAIVEGVLDTWLSASRQQNGSAVEDKARQMILETSAEGYISCARALQSLDYKRYLNMLALPVLYIVGSHDGPHSAEMRELASLTPGASLIEIPGAAHLSNLDQPALFNTAVRDFLGQRLAPLPANEWAPELGDVLQQMNGQPLNVHSLMAHNPQLMRAWWDFRNHSVTGGSLGQRNAELIILRVAARMGSWYEWAAHVDRALQLDMPADDIQAILDPLESYEWNNADRALLTAVDELTATHRLRPASLAQLEDQFSQPQVMDLMAIHGMYLILAAMILSWNLPVDADILRRIKPHTEQACFLAASARLAEATPLTIPTRQEVES